MDGHDDKGNPIIYYDNKCSHEEDGVMRFSLSHSCDKWVIGTLDEAIQFHNTLGRMIDNAKNRPDIDQLTGNINN